MDIIYKSIRIVDYTNNRVSQREVPDEFNDYILELINHIEENDSIRTFKTKSNQTEVISGILSVIKIATDDEFIRVTDIIANRLLIKESEAQNKVSKMKVNVKKGSLIQALIYNNDNDIYSYLLAKVEHSDFVDDNDFSFKTGFSKDKKTLWKSCLIDIDENDTQTFYAKIYSDNKAKYWSDAFLELEELITDEKNTSNAFKYIDGFLNRNIKGKSISDYTHLRNSVIVYFRTHEHFDYYKMIEDVFENYCPAEIEIELYKRSLDKIKTISETSSFDTQFTPVLTAINAKMRKTYPVNSNVDIVLKNGVEDLASTITSIEEMNGNRYLKIKVTDIGTFDSFKR